MEIARSLSKVALFQCFSEEELSQFLKEGGMKLMHYAKNQLVALQGDACTSLDVIVEGRLSLQSIDEQGTVFKARVLEAGEIWGATLLFSRYNQYPLQVVCDRACSVIRIKRSVVLSLCSAKPDFLVGLLQIISDRTYELGLTVTKLNEQTLRQSLLDYLSRLSLQQGSDMVTLPMSKTELAHRLGYARTSLSRELALLRNEELLSFNGRQVHLHISSKS